MISPKNYYYAVFSNYNVIGFTMAILGVEQIGITFSSLVFAPSLISQSLSVSSEQNHQQKLDWLFFPHQYQLELLQYVAL
jgi:hypothetical protein